MDKIALELLTHIAGFACTDGGYTARSLMLTCQHLHVAVLPVRFYSVAFLHRFNGTSIEEKVKQFLACLGSERARSGDLATSKVRHLFVTADPPSPFAGLLELFGTRADASASAESPIAALLRAVATEVETLTIAGDLSIDVGDLVFSSLRELTLGGYGFPVTRASHYSDAPRVLSSYPSLERLHCYPGSEISVVASEFAPQLTHLRVSGVDFPETRWQAVVTQACNIPLDAQAAGPHQSIKFPRMRLVIVQPSPPHEDHETIYEWLSAGQNRCLTNLWSTLERSTVPVYILPAETYLDYKADSNLKIPRSHWASRIEGGDGCWAISPEYSRSAQKGNSPPEYLIPKEEDD